MCSRRRYDRKHTLLGLPNGGSIVRAKGALGDGVVPSGAGSLVNQKKRKGSALTRRGWDLLNEADEELE